MKDLLLLRSHSPKEIQEKLNLKFGTEFEYSKVRNAYYKVKKTLFGIPNHEAQDLVQLLKPLRESGFLLFETKSNNLNNALEAVVFCSSGMIHLYRHYKDMLILDTTFGLNRFNMPLLTLAGVDNNGKTVVFGFAFLKDESFDVKKWVFDTFLSFTGETPEAVISDGCPAFAKAIRESFPLAKHYLCAWHIQLNLKRHFAGFKKSLKNKSKFIFLFFFHFLRITT